MKIRYTLQLTQILTIVDKDWLRHACSFGDFRIIYGQVFEKCMWFCILFWDEFSEKWDLKIIFYGVGFIHENYLVKLLKSVFYISKKQKKKIRVVIQLNDHPSPLLRWLYGHLCFIGLTTLHFHFSIGVGCYYLFFYK
jgi:hypothetical protein